MPAKIIVAYNENRVIGNGNKIPWRLAADMEHFKAQTTGCPVVMGRKTWESLPKKFRPLPDRTNIVVTRNPEWQSDDPQPHSVAHTLKEALNTALNVAYPDKSIWIIGGSEIYRAALDQGFVDEVIATEVKGTHEGDVFFPELSEEKWKKTSLVGTQDFTIVRYTKRA